jgi:outer membrane immunogenic protein
MKHRFDTNNTTATFTQNDSDDAWGYQAGGGIEAMVTKNISLGLEYLYTDINDKDYAVTATGGPFSLAGTSTQMRPADQKFNYHAVRGSVNFRF